MLAMMNLQRQFTYTISLLASLLKIDSTRRATKCLKGNCRKQFALTAHSAKKL